MPFRNWAASTASVLPLSRSARSSPTQTMGVRPNSSAAWVRLRTVSSVSLILAAFAVADDGVAGAHGEDHGAGDLAGEGAFPGPPDILRADPDVATFDGIEGRGGI